MFTYILCRAKKNSAEREREREREREHNKLAVPTCNRNLQQMAKE
jgi:hypothetical protein